MIEQFQQLVLKDISLFIPETILLITFCVSILLNLVSKNEKFVAYISIIGILFAIYYSFQTIKLKEIIFSGMYVVDGLSSFFKIIIGLTSIYIFLFSFQRDELKKIQNRLGEYYSLLVALTLGMFLMTGANNLIMMYLSIELSSITSYILSGVIKEEERGSEAALKYILYGAISSGVMLYGISIIYGLTQSLNANAIQYLLFQNGANSIALMIATIFVIVGFGYKISAVPFHFWTPDVYEGSPITITALLSVASKGAGFAMMIRFFTEIFSFQEKGIYFNLVQQFDWQMILGFISVLTMTVGNMIAIWQTNMKRLLAYSSIAHAGYMLMGLVVLSNEGIVAIMIYFTIYLFMNLGAFYIVMIIAQKIRSENIEDYKGLAYRSSFVSVILTILLISLTGLPPTAGFIGKLYLFSSLLNAKWFVLAIIGALNSVVSLFYYMKVVRNMFLKQVEGESSIIQFLFEEKFYMISFAVIVVLFGIYFSPIIEFVKLAVK